MIKIQRAEKRKNKNKQKTQWQHEGGNQRRNLTAWGLWFQQLPVSPCDSSYGCTAPHHPHPHHHHHRGPLWGTTDPGGREKRVPIRRMPDTVTAVHRLSDLGTDARRATRMGDETRGQTGASDRRTRQPSPRAVAVVPRLRRADRDAAGVSCSYLNRGESLIQSSKSTVIFSGWGKVLDALKMRISSPGRVEVEMLVSDTAVPSLGLRLRRRLAPLPQSSPSEAPEPLRSVLDPPCRVQGCS